MTTLRPCIPAVLLAALAACGTAESAEPAAEQPQAAVAAAAVEAAAAPPAAVPAPPAGPQAAPTGYYECYFHGHYGLQNSSMTSMRIHGPAEYEAMEERGRYAESEGTLRMETGALAGRVAHVRASDGKPALVFIRDENEVDGEPTIDISDTWCYFEPR